MSDVKNGLFDTNLLRVLVAVEKTNRYLGLINVRVLTKDAKAPFYHDTLYIEVLVPSFVMH